MTARNNDDRRDADYDGMDALMAALVDDPLPEGARQDASFMAAHRAAAADVTLLREQLLLIGETLAHATGTAAGAAGTEPEAGEQVRAEAGGEAERAPAAGPAADAEPEAGARVREEASDPAGRTPVAGMAAGPAVGGLEPEAGGTVRGEAGVVSLAGRRSRPRPLVVALRGFAAAVAAGAVVGMGWLVVQSGQGSGDDAAGSSAADSAAGPHRADQESKLSQAGYLACARLVAEGTVAEVEPVPGTGQDRVTLDVDRYYKPADGQDRIVFPMDEGAEPQPRPGERVLVGITRGQAQPDLWKAGEKAIAPERAGIAAALRESGSPPCR
ncbi:hypothetical protein [Streptomyces coeruleorubidus]|uniref:hypothetical protein n=1 Tax=Streptomyces coeruleorubidus TaxID=116188 RepID=UPI0033B653AD